MTRHGGPDALEVRNVTAPTPGAGEVLVAVRAAGVNNTDIWTREGAYGLAGDPEAPAGWRHVPIATPRIHGADVCGVVEAVEIATARPYFTADSSAGGLLTGSIRVTGRVESPAIELTAISVEMKVLVEQMREQVQNIE